MPPPVACPHCREELDIPPEFRAREVRCAVCRNTFTPATVEAAEPPVARRSGVEPRDSAEDRPRRRRRRRSAGGGGALVIVLLTVVGLGCLGCGGLVALAVIVDHPELHKYDDPAGRFEAAFPTTPTNRQEKADDGATGQRVEAHRNFPQETYFVSYTDLPAAPAEAEVEGALKAACGRAVKAVPGTREESRSDVTQDGLPGKTLHLAHPDGSSTVARVLLDGKRVYVVGITGRGVAPQNQRIGAFWNSFKVKTPQEKK